MVVPSMSTPPKASLPRAIVGWEFVLSKTWRPLSVISHCGFLPPFPKNVCAWQASQSRGRFETYRHRLAWGQVLGRGGMPGSGRSGFWSSGGYFPILSICIFCILYPHFLAFFVCGEAQTMEWSVLLLLLLLFLLALLLYYRIYARYRKTYKNKSVDTSDIGYCAKFQPIVTCIFAKNRQKRFCNFLTILRFLPLWPQKRPQNSNLTWCAQHNLGLPDLFYFIIFFVRSLYVP